MANVTYVTQDKIIVYSPLCPQGKNYKYADVEQVYVDRFLRIIHNH